MESSGGKLPSSRLILELSSHPNGIIGTATTTSDFTEPVSLPYGLAGEKSETKFGNCAEISNRILKFLLKIRNRMILPNLNRLQISTKISSLCNRRRHALYFYNFRRLKNTASDSGEEFFVEQLHTDPIDLRFRVGGPSMTAFVTGEAARLFAVSEPASREDSFIDGVGTDIERNKLSTVTDHIELSDFSFSSVFESSGSNEADLLLNHNFASETRNSYGRPILAVPPTRADVLIRHIPQSSDNNPNNATRPTSRNGPIMPVPITAVVISLKIPVPN